MAPKLLAPRSLNLVDYNAYFTDALGRLRTERRYRVFADLERIAPAVALMRFGNRRRSRRTSMG